MTIGREEHASGVNQTRDRYKLWNRLDAKSVRAKEVDEQDMQRYHGILTHGKAHRGRG